MKYFSTKDRNEIVSFKEATLKGLASNRGLFMPIEIPELPVSFFNNIDNLSNLEIAINAMFPFVDESLGYRDLKEILEQTLTFEIPLKEISDNVYALELYHGPTLAFKDIGARFMANCMAKFGSDDKKTTILVATSGDTGGAVANGFWKVPGVEVVVLYPKSKISKFQEDQITTLGENITAIEVDGVFDDCQELVKSAFSDNDLNEKLNLSSANSINIARLLPQSIYYHLMYRQLPKNKEIVVSVPSGNFGNLTAGMIAKRMGLPIKKLVAANNANNIFTKYLETGVYQPKSSVATVSNAMDVGDPSNFDRIQELYSQNHAAIKNDVSSSSYSDEETVNEIARVYQESGYLLDPHGAVGHLALKRELKENQVGVVLETAHPKKFAKVVQEAVPAIEFEFKKSKKQYIKIPIKNDYNDFKNYLLGSVPAS